MAYTVYLAGVNTPAGVSATATAPITHAVATGDTIILCISAGGSLAANVDLVSDTQGNIYNLAQVCVNSQGMWQYWCQNATALSTSDSVTVNFSSNATSKELAVIGVNGAAATSTLVDQFAQAGGTSTAPSATTAALGSSSELAIAAFSSGNGGGAPSLAGGWTQIAQVHLAGNAWLTVAYQALAASTAVTASATITSTAWAAQVMTIAAQGALGGRWYHSVAGAPTASQFQVVTRTAGCTSVQLKTATDAALTQNVATTGAQAPDSYGYVRHTATDLAAQTQYYYQLLSSSVPIGPVGKCRTLPTAGTPAASFTVALVSCVTQQASDTTAMDDWVTYNADLCIFTGDQNYSSTTSTDTRAQVQLYEQQILQAGIGSAASAAAGYPSSYSMMHGQAWGYYTRSDHEAGPDNGDSNNSYTATNIAAAQQVFPYGTLGDTVNTPVHGLYQTWVAGRVRFIMIDNRNTDRSPGANADDASKTNLGAVQLAWLKSQLIQSEPVKVIVGDVQWAGTPTAGLDSSGPDKWWSYSTERAAILAYITANAAQVGQVLFWHGDTHAVGTMTPAANATWGGFPVYVAAPMHNTGGGLDNGVFTSIYNNSGGNCRQYGRITITDNGRSIAVRFQGWDAVNQVAQVTQTDTFTIPYAGSAGSCVVQVGGPRVA